MSKLSAEPPAPECKHLAWHRKRESWCADCGVLECPLCGCIDCRCGQPAEPPAEQAPECCATPDVCRQAGDCMRPEQAHTDTARLCPHGVERPFMRCETCDAQSVDPLVARIKYDLEQFAHAPAVETLLREAATRIADDDRVIRENSAELARLYAKRDEQAAEITELRDWNERVSVCRDHVREIVDGACAVCALQAANAEIAHLRDVSIMRLIDELEKKTLALQAANARADALYEALRKHAITVAPGGRTRCFQCMAEATGSHDAEKHRKGCLAAPAKE